MLPPPRDKYWALPNNIGLQKSYTNKSGELVLVCDSKESRDNLSTIVDSIDNTIPTKRPTGKRPTIAIVGLHKDYTKEQIVTMVVKQNEFVRKFMTSNNIEDHFKVLVVRPTKRNENVFQAFVSVSAMLRAGIKQYKDKITLGLTSCKVYDQYHVKYKDIKPFPKRIAFIIFNALMHSHFNARIGNGFM